MEDHLVHTRQKRRVANTTNSRKDEVAHTLKGLLAEASNKSVVETEMLNHPWRGAEAYHFFLLTQSLYYAGKFKECLQTVSSPYIVICVGYSVLGYQRGLQMLAY